MIWSLPIFESDCLGFNAGDQEAANCVGAVKGSLAQAKADDARFR
jgi:hypothetical protein